MSNKPFVGSAITSLFRSLWRLNLSLHGISTSKLASIIQTIWERNEVCIKQGETKLFPKLVDEDTDEHGNPQLFYSMLPGMDPSKINNSCDQISAYLKTNVLLKPTPNHPSAHFRMTILAGRLLDLIEANIPEIVENVKAKGKGLWVPIAYSRRGLECINLAKDSSPHILIGGGTGGGKSTLLRFIMTMLHILYTPAEVAIWACDFKHGNEIGLLGKNPLLFERTISDPYESTGYFSELYDEIKRRYQLFHRAGVASITKYNEKVKPEKRLPHIVLPIDEYGKLEGSDFDNARLLVKHITGDGRSAGVHAIISTHRPNAKLVDGTLKNNFPVVIGFRCNPISARVLFGEDNFKVAEEIDSEIDGRAVIAYISNVLVQVPWISEEETERIMTNYQKPLPPSTLPNIQPTA